MKRNSDLTHADQSLSLLAAVNFMDILLHTGILPSAEDSLFYYKGSMKWTDFHDPDFVPTFDPVFASSSLEDQARDLCNGDTACLFDVAATGRLEIGSSALSASEEQSINAALAVPSKLMCMQAY